MNNRTLIALLIAGAGALLLRRPALALGPIVPPGAPPTVARWRDLAAEAGQAFDVEPRLILAVIWQESGGVETARGAAGEVGLMQITPIAARDIGDSAPAWAARENVYQGTEYLATLRDRYGARTFREMLRGYNGGPGAISGGVPAANRYADEVLRKAGWLK